MTVVVNGKTIEEWDAEVRRVRKHRLLVTLYWFIAVVVVGLLNYAAPHSFFVAVQLGLWIGVVVSLIRVFLKP